MRKIKRHVAKLMVTVMISTLLSSFFSSVAYANEITDLIPGTVAPIEGVVDVAGGENEAEETSYETPVAEESIQEETADADDVSENTSDQTDVDAAETEESTDKDAETDSETEDPSEIISDEASEEDKEDETSEMKQEEELSEETSEEANHEDISEETSEEKKEEAKEEVKEEEGKKTSGKKNQSGNDELTETLDGWVEDGGETYFYRDGKMVCDEIIEYDGNLYYFDNDGLLYTDGKFNRGYDYEIDEPFTYYANENGTLLTNEWYDDYYYFGENGSMLKHCVKLMDDGFYYGFDYDGRRYENTGFSLYYFDSETEAYIENCYRANADGKLLRNSWYVTDWGDEEQLVSYYGDDCKAYVDGIHTVDGKDYYFNEYGEVQRNGAVSYKGTAYIIENYELYPVNGSGWFEKNGKKYYLKDKENAIFASFEIMEIEGALYGFDREGQMYNGEDFTCGSFYVEEEDEWYSNCYRAKQGGQLYQNEWYKDGDRPVSYYGEDGRAYTLGIYNIGGKNYYFDEWGKIPYDTVISANNKNYYIDSEGTLLETPENGWFEQNGNYFYFENGSFLKDCVKLLDDGFYYGFDRTGRRFENIEFYISQYDEETGDYLGEERYVAGADGKLLRNAWHRDEYEEDVLCTYHGDDCKAYKNGIYNVDGKEYYFSYWGDVIRDGNVVVDGTRYIIQDYVLYPILSDGFTTINGIRYYIKDGEMVKYDVIEIDGALYGFNSDGQMYTNTMFSFWKYDPDTDESWSMRYCAKEDGKLLVNEWYKENEDWGSWYYFGEDGVAYRNGFYEINGKNYCFDKYSKLLRNTSKVIDGVNYFMDENGVAVSMEGYNGWFEHGGYKFYYENGNAITKCNKKIDGDWYYFDDAGRLLTNTLYSTSIYDENDDYIGMVKFYSREDGKLYTNKWDYNTYYGPDGKSYMGGMFEIDGKKYLFDKYSELKTNCSVVYEGVTYYLDAAGVATVITSDGWNEINGSQVYFENGELVKNCIKQIDEKTYVFDENGLICNGSRAIINSDIYFPDEEGNLRRNQWVIFNDEYYYVGNDGAAYKGIHEIDGKCYYFQYNGTRRNNSTSWGFNGILKFGTDQYLIDSNYEVFKAPNHSWVHASSGDYYVVDGYFVRDAVVTIDGKDYAFEFYGNLLKNELINYKDRAYKTDENGVAVYAEDGWYQKGDDRYYVQNGKMVTGITDIDGDTYAFETDGRLIRGKGFDRNLYVINSDAIPSTWNSTNPYAFIITESGNAVNPYEHYSIGLSGYMRSNSGNSSMPYSILPYDASSNAYNPYIAAEDGKLLKNTWYHDEVGDYWYYFDERCRKVSGWNVIDGKTYYMDVFGVRLTGTVEIDGQTYSFDDNGVLITGSGWITSDGKTYYRDADGKNHTGWLNLDESRYYMDTDGVMQTGWLDLDGTKYYLDAEGVMQTGTWVTDGGKKYHLDNTGVLETNCWVTDGSKTYHVNKKGVMQTDCLLNVDGTYYRLKTTGVLLKNSFYTLGSYRYFFGDDGVRKENCWFTHEGKTYYAGEKGIIKKNTVFTDTDGKMYAINSSGVMQKNGKNNMLAKAGSKRYVVNKNGVIQVNGWKIVDGKKYYAGKDGAIVKRDWVVVGSKKYHVDKDGVMQTGWLKISKKWYYFTPKTGVMVYGKILTIDGKKYKFDKNGVCTNK